jgi:hypothetical protein
MNLPIRRLLAVFFAAELVLFIAIHGFSIPLRSGTLHYASIVLCALLCFLVKGDSEELKWTRIAFVFTLAADWFLTYLQTNQLLGTVLFLLAQIAFTKRLLASEKRPRVKIVLRIALALMFLLGGWIFAGRFDLLLAVALVYYAMLLANAVDATFFRRPEAMLAVGLWFYVLCDLLVGLSQSAGYLVIAQGSPIDWILHGPIHWIWVFYLPSQALIAASAVWPLRKDIRGQKTKTGPLKADL